MVCSFKEILKVIMYMVSTSIIILKLIATMFGVFVVATLMYPIAFVVAQALLDKPTIILTSFDQLIRYGISYKNFIDIVKDPIFWQALLNTIIVAITTIIVAITIIIPAAYAFSRFSFRGRDALLYLYLIVSQAGGGLGIIAVLALYIFMLRLAAYGISLFHLLALPFIYVSGMVPFQTWLMKSYFDQLPRVLDDAAFIDGASWFNIIFRVVLPASKAAFVIIALFAFMGAWGEFIIASILDIMTLGKYIYESAVAGQAGIMRPATFAAASIVYAIPIVVLFAIAQKYIGEAYRLGIAKG